MGNNNYNAMAMIGPGMGRFAPGGNPGLTYVLDAATKAFDIAFIPSSAITLGSVSVYINAKTGSPTAGFRIETDSSGRRSGTLAWANANATVQTVSSTGWMTVTLTASGPISPGTIYHIVIYNDSAAPGTTPFTIQDQNITAAQAAGVGVTPESWTASGTAMTAGPPPTGGAWTTRYGPIFMLISTDATPVYIGQPVDSVAIAILNSTTGYGAKFISRLSGAIVGFFWGHLTNGANGVSLKLYDSSDNLLGTATLPAGVQAALGNVRLTAFLPFDTGPVQVIAGNTYRAVLFDSTSSDRFDYFTVSNATYAQAAPELVDWQWTQGHTGSWADTLGKLPHIFQAVFSSIASGGAVVKSLIAGIR